MRLRTLEEINTEAERLEQLYRSGTLNGIRRARTASALDTLRWVLSEQAIISPSQLCALP